MIKQFKLTMLLFLITSSALFSQNSEIELNENWDLKDQNNEYSLNVNLPNTVFEALIEAEKIEDPFYGTNERKMGKIFNKDWEFSLNTVITKKMILADKLFLTFDGIDTIGSIYLNGKKIIDVENMHRQYRIDLKKENISAGNLKIAVKIKSPSLYALNAAKEGGVSLMNIGNGGLKGAPYTRKAWYSFGWDWGAQIPDIGIWKKVYFELINIAEISNTKIVSQIKFNKPTKKIKYPEAENATINIDVEVNQFDDSPLTIEVIIDGNGIYQSKTVKIENNSAYLNFSIKNPKLWWIYELGEPNLYSITTILKSGNKILEGKTEKIGIRKIEVVRNKDKWGESFFFKLNGVPVFAKGANWIPADTFIPRGIKKGIVIDRLKDAKAANYNFIRVWGGGIYESEQFYNFCDTEGMLVWQDFAFACYATPNIQSYFDNVEIEAIQNVTRLRNHPSLAIWVGNNEIEVAWKKWAYTLLFPSAKPAYDKIFNKLLPSIVSNLDSERTYWPSSPHSGGAVNDPNNPNYGDSHYWSVWHGGKPFSAYRNYPSRFMSEFGFESFPDIKTINEFCPKDQQQFNSDIMENHQKNGAGNKKIISYMKKRFSVPDSFEKQVILSQLTQAEAMEYGVDFWRKQRANNQSMGALYWQFNDTWPAASWSSVDYYGRWKALHYFAKRFFEPLYCSVIESKNKVELWIINDLKDDKNLKFSWSIQRADGEILTKGEENIIAKATNSFNLKTVDVRGFRRGLKNKRDIVLFWELKDENNKNVSRGFRLFDKPKKFPIKKSNFVTTIKEVEKNMFRININSSQNALYSHIVTKYDFISSDNYFHLEKDIPYFVTLNSKKNITIEELKKSLSIESFYELIN